MHNNECRDILKNDLTMYCQWKTNKQPDFFKSFGRFDVHLIAAKRFNQNKMEKIRRNNRKGIMLMKADVKPNFIMLIVKVDFFYDLNNYSEPKNKNK